MEIAYITATILQTFAVSLGVGASTMAVVQFLTSMTLGEVGTNERKIMGVNYTVLRVAMGAILLATLGQAAVIFSFISYDYFTPFTIAVWAVIAVLFINAIGMTMHWVPRQLGPGIQAGSWYTLGALFSLIPLGLTSFTHIQFALAYVGMMLLAIAVINGFVNHLKRPA